MIRPTPLEWLIASKYTLPFWIGAGLYVWFGWGGDWDALAQEQQLALVIGGGMFAVAYLKSFTTVFFYEREQNIYRNAHISPEEKWRRQTVAQTFFLVLVAAALLYAGWQWFKSPVPEPQTSSYKAAGIGIGGASILATTAYLKVRTWRSTAAKTEKPAIVSWCLPVPTHSPTHQEIYSNLPDYCQSLLVAGEKRSPAIDNDQLRFADTRTQNTHA